MYERLRRASTRARALITRTCQPVLNLLHPLNFATADDPDGTPTTPTFATASTIRERDLVLIGGELFEVLNLIPLPGGGRGLRFSSGEMLTIHSRTRLFVCRPVIEWR